MIHEGRKVAIEYTLTLADGSLVDTNRGQEPLTYHHGRGEILPALEHELEGLAPEQGKQVVLPPEKGYGRVDPDLFQEVEAEMVPQEARAPGTPLVARDREGQERRLRVHEVKGDRVVLDFNHPLAGETLHFEVRVLGVE